MHISGDATDKRKLLMPIYFLNKEAKIYLQPAFDPGPAESYREFSMGAVDGGFGPSSYSV